MTGAMSGCFKVFIWLWKRILNLTEFICSFCELHLIKVVAFAVMALCCSQVNALHLVVVIALLFSTTFGISAIRCALCFITPFLSILFLAKMVYQTRFAPKYIVEFGCEDFNEKLPAILTNTVMDAEWWGFYLIENGQMLNCYKSYMIVMLILTLDTAIRIRQRILRLDAGLPFEAPYVLYKNTTRRDADRNLRSCLRYLLNYGFYKFGVEITLSFCFFAVAYRVDVFSIVYSLWIFCLFFAKRHTLTLMWPCLMTTLVFSIMWQYCMAVGLSKYSCYEYPWEEKQHLVTWLFLPSFQYPPETSKILVDYVLLLLVQRQQTVFEIEKRYGDRYPGGSNREIWMNYYQRNFINPVPDHTGKIKSWLDLAKFLSMSSLFRLTLAFEFWNGAVNANLLSLGYLVGAFVFLWIDYDLCLWQIDKILKWWNTLIGYIVVVIFFKTILEFVACAYGLILREYFSWVFELVFLRCSYSESHEGIHSIYWDVVCFTLAIFQRRYFQSYYFLHEVEDVVGVHRLQAKGARLMDELHETKLKAFQSQERKTLIKIKKNMNRIKAWQKRMHGPNYQEPYDHAAATYMGDYLMFEDLDQGSVESDESSSSSGEYEFDDQGKPKKPESGKKLTMTEFIGNVLRKGGEESVSNTEKKREKQRPPPKPSTAKKASVAKGDGKPRTSTASEKSRRESKKSSSDEAFFDRRKTTYFSEEEKSKNSWKLFTTFLETLVLSMTRFFNKTSKDYRYVEAVMKAERNSQKLQRKDGPHETTGSITRSMFADRRSHSRVEDQHVEIRKKVESEEIIGPEDRKSLQTLLVNLINSICMFIMSKTELLCYISVFLHTIMSPTLLSIPLPLLVFLWGSLTTIRPTTTFWTVLIAYTEVTVVIKALFQSLIFPWNRTKRGDSAASYPPLFLGIHRDNQYVVGDLLLLLCLFLHRYKLKTLGLWNRSSEEETIPPQNLLLYRELLPESELNNARGKLYPRKRLNTEISVAEESTTMSMLLAIWKCTSRATAKQTYWGKKLRTKILIKEIEGPIIKTHEGRRLEPTGFFVNQIPDEALEGNVVLRVYIKDFSDPRILFCRLSWVQHFTSIRKFYLELTARDWRVAADFYTLMFICEFISFLLIFFGYSSFTVSRELEINDFALTENQVPLTYLITMILHFLIIITDRILYLRKNVVGKLVLQIILVLVIHGWMFIVIPNLTERFLYIPQTYYIISCFYFLMSAYQLRVGYPMRVQGHFLCKKYGYVNYYCYKGLQFIPFFNQLRTVLDFICTHSSLTMMEWIRMESIFQLIFENKCSRRADYDYPVPRGLKCPKSGKYGPGLAVLAGMFVVIWLPFLVFALFNTVAIPNVPVEATLEVHIGNSGSIYITKASFSEIATFNQAQFRILQSLYKDNRKVWPSLSLYDERDIGVLRFKFDPYEPWLINSKELSTLNETIQNLDIPVLMFFIWDVRRGSKSVIIDEARGYKEIVLKMPNEARKQLALAMFNTSIQVHLRHIIPKFMEINNDGEALPMDGFLSGEQRYRNATLSLQKDDKYMWWRLQELPDYADEIKISKIPYERSDMITIYTFNEKGIPKLLLYVSKKGIIGLYLSIVFVMWTVFRRLMWKYPYIMFDYMPNPDPPLKLCQDIYLARENQEFALEEDLFAKLIFLFRSPETLIKYTRLSSRQ